MNNSINVIRKKKKKNDNTLNFNSFFCEKLFDDN